MVALFLFGSVRDMHPLFAAFALIPLLLCAAAGFLLCERLIGTETLIVQRKMAPVGRGNYLTERRFQYSRNIF